MPPLAVVHVVAGAIGISALVLASATPAAFTHLEGDALFLPIFGEGGTPKA